MDSFTLKTADGTDVACYRWRAAGSAVGTVQITHGMGEHAARYDYPAQAFARAGFHVYANDHRGHGKTAKPGALGDFGPGGWNGLVDDMAQLTRRAREETRLPVILLGHSMGSFASQQYVLDHSALIAGLILSGSVAFDQLPIDFEREVDLTAMNAPFEPARTPFDWLSRDPAQVDLYVADLLCGFGVNLASTKAMAEALKRTTDPAQLARIRKDLPIHIFAGDRDPVNNGLAWLKPLAERYRAAGIRDVSEQYYKDGRHEMFNETNRDAVIADVVAWMRRVVA